MISAVLASPHNWPVTVATIATCQQEPGGSLRWHATLWSTVVSRTLIPCPSDVRSHFEAALNAYRGFYHILLHPDDLALISGQPNRSLQSIWARIIQFRSHRGAFMTALRRGACFNRG